MIEERIKLAVLMGWKNYLTGSGAAIWEHDDHSTRLSLPDPFTDANDDYACLEWARAEWNGQGTWAEYVAAFNLPDSEGFQAITKWHYEIGDYARALLETIDD